MSAFIKIDSSLVNVDAIRYVSPYSLYRNCSGTVYFCDGEELKLQFLEPFEEVIAKILAASTAKEKENLPPTPPIREKETLCAKRARRARVRERFKKPTVEEVAAHIAEKGYTFDAEEFWNFYESKGWRVGSHVMRSWTSACVTWQKIEKRRAEREAHIDAKMDEREAKREQARSKAEAAYGRARKADNWIPSTEAERKGFADALGR